LPYNSVFKDGLFEGQSVIVTGGGSGIGRCTAHELIALGAKVALVGRRLDRLETVAAEIAAEGGQADCYACDIRVEDEVQSTIAAILDAHGRIDGLVNNAGGQFPALLKDISQKGWETVVRSNLTGGFLMARECYNQWMADHGGAIVNITADIVGGMPRMGHSGAARAGMENLTETAATEWAQSGVRVNSVAPGYVASSGMDTYDDATSDEMRGWKNFVPLRRHGDVAEVSAAIVFLLCEAAAFISGACIRVDGGAPGARRNWDLPDHKNAPTFDGFHLEHTANIVKDDAG